MWEYGRDFGSIHPGSARAHRFGSLGERSLIAFPPASLYGEASIHIGADTLVAAYATLAAGYALDQGDVPPRALVIGDRCVIGLRTALVAHESIVVGDDVWFGQDVFVTDANHGLDDPDVPYGQQIGTHEPVAIGDGCWIGHGAVILPGVTVHPRAVVAAGAVVIDDVPPRHVVGGVPAVPLRDLDAR